MFGSAAQAVKRQIFFLLRDALYFLVVPTTSPHIPSPPHILIPHLPARTLHLSPSCPSPITSLPPPLALSSPHLPTPHSLTFLTLIPPHPSPHSIPITLLPSPYLPPLSHHPSPPTFHPLASLLSEPSSSPTAPHPLTSQPLPSLPTPQRITDIPHPLTPSSLLSPRFCFRLLASHFTRVISLGSPHHLCLFLSLPIIYSILS